MKTLRAILILSIISLFMFWAFATVEVQTTTPLVDPDGTSEIVGSLRFILSSPDFGDPNSTSTDYYVLIRVQMTGNAKVKTIGHWGPADVTPTSPIYLALENDQNMQNVTQDPTAVRIVRIDPNGAFFDILFTKNLHVCGTNTSVVNPCLDSNHRIRFTLGLPECAAPTDDINSFASATSTYTPPADPASPTDLPDCGGTVGQQDTRICVDFSGTAGDGEFLGGFWSVGLVNYHSDANADLGSSYNTNYQPANPALAQEGGPSTTCSIIPNWPGKGDCGSFGVDNKAPTAKYCDCQPGGQGQSSYDPCDSGPVWGEIDFGTGHIFTVQESCQKGYLYEDNGILEVTLNDNGVTDTYLGNDGKAWLDGGGLASPQALNVTYPDDHTMDITISGTDNNRTSPYCVAIDLGSIYFDCCGVRNSSDDVAVTVNVDYTPPNFVCGGKPAPITNWQVATIIGCNKPTQPTTYYLYLYYPYLPPVKDPNLTWWCGLAVTNYANEPTDGGVLLLYEADGDAFQADVPALPGHGMWVTLLDQLTLTPMGSDTTGGDEPMSGILIMQVTDPPYTLLNGSTIDDGSIAGIDSFVLMGDNTQAYGYTARHFNSTTYYSGISGPIWFKKAHK